MIIKICFISSVPLTLWLFYKSLAKRLQKEKYEVHIVASDLPELYLFANCGFNIRAVEITRTFSPLKDAMSLWKLYRYLSKEKFDIVHTHTPKGGLIGIIAAFIARIPIRIHTIHGLPLETASGFKRKLLWVAEWVTIHFATKRFAVSNSLAAKIFQERICRNGTIKVLGDGSACGIDLNKFRISSLITAQSAEIRKKYDLPSDAFVVGYIGRIAPDKGITTLIDSFVSACEQNNNIYLFLVGEFETVRDTIPDEVFRIIRTHPNIRNTGKFEREIIPFYGAMDILCLPSLREGFGLVLIEAAALGIPTIATRVTGCVDAVEEGVTGILVRPEAKLELLNAILKLCNEPDTRRQMCAAAQLRVYNLFDSKRLINLHLEEYKRLLHSKQDKKQ